MGKEGVRVWVVFGERGCIFLLGFEVVSPKVVPSVVARQATLAYRWFLQPAFGCRYPFSVTPTLFFFSFPPFFSWRGGLLIWPAMGRQRMGWDACVQKKRCGD